MDSRVRVFAKRRRHRGLRRRRSKQHNSDHSDDDSTASDTWYHQEANNRSVDNITIKFFYKPRTLTLLFVCLVAMVSFAFARSACRCPGCDGSRVGHVFGILGMKRMWIIILFMGCYLSSLCLKSSVS